LEIHLEARWEVQAALEDRWDQEDLEIHLEGQWGLEGLEIHLGDRWALEDLEIHFSDQWGQEDLMEHIMKMLLLKITFLKIHLFMMTIFPLVKNMKHMN